MEITKQMKKLKVTTKDLNLFLFTRFILFIFIFALSLSIISCDKNRVFEENKAIEGNGWNVNDKISFVIDIEDTLAPHNVYINVRHKSDYPWANVYLFLNTTFPNGTFGRDTLDCILANDKGKWLGEGIGDIKSHQLMFMKGIRFKKAGKYKFEFQHAMRTDNLPGIIDFGMRIEKAKH